MSRKLLTLLRRRGVIAAILGLWNSATANWEDVTENWEDA